MWVSMMRSDEQPRTLANATKARLRRAPTAPHKRKNCGVPKRQHLAADDTREARPQEQADGDHQRAQALAQGDGKQQGEQDGREGEGGVDQAHQDAVDRAADIARDDADGETDAAARGQRQQRHEQADPCAVDQAAQDVAAEGVGA
jgi:hypothetical protein